MSMKLHPRHWLVVEAKLDIQGAVNEAISRHMTLTHAELTHILLDTAMGWNKYAIRDEREAPQTAPEVPHSTPEAKAGRNESDGERKEGL